eukprot:scaffold53633_cov51-Phaeocystis_antarctica.AAC.3
MRHTGAHSPEEAAPAVDRVARRNTDSTRERAHALVGGTAAVGASLVRWDPGGALLLQDAKEIVDLERAVLGQVCAVHGVVDLVLAEARAEGVGLQV